MQQLILIHIGPVQDFIASARRSRDLWYGSWVLSELSKAAAAAVQSQAASNRLIFPASGLDLVAGSEINVANRIVALVDNPAAAAKEAKTAVNTRLKELRLDALKNLKGPLRDEQDAIAQIQELPEIFWVSSSMDSSYEAARKMAEALLAARKNTRGFKQPSWGANAPKSSLDGVRESVIPRVAYDQPDTLFWKYGARRAEQLSGVDLLKRLGNRGDESRFPSTSHMAARPLLKRLSQQPDIQKAWRNYVGKLPSEIKDVEKVPPHHSYPVFGDLDGSVLFGSRLAENLDGDALEAVQKALAAFLHETVAGEEPIPYYALLLGDGDGMGKVIDAQKTPDKHINLSQNLAAFAVQVRQIVAEYEGALVYAGGDDVLAFLPLHTALPCAKALADSFRQQLAGFVNSVGAQATFSAGIAISHHLEPLSDALQLARNSERLAKAVPGKDALAVAMDKRGGITRAISGKWETLYPQLLRYIYYQRESVDAFPAGAAYELRDAVLEMGGEAHLEKAPELQQVVIQEARRILLRKRAQQGQQPLPQSVIDSIEAVIVDQDSPISELAEALVIARLFARAEDQAGLPVTAPAGIKELTA